MVIVYAGKDGPLRWELNRKTHVLDFQGAGPLSDFNPFDGRFPGWLPLMAQVHEAHINEGITRIGDYAFYPYDHGDFYDLQPRLHRVTFPFTLESIGCCAFRANTHLHLIDLSNHTNLQVIDRFAFASCFKAKAADLSGCIRLHDISDHAFHGCDELSYLNLQGCSSLPEKTLQRIRSEVPPHIPIIMPSGEVSCRDQSPAAVQRECRVLLGPAAFRGPQGEGPA